MRLGQAPKLPPHRRMVLVVEDECLIAMYFELLLRQNGWRVLGPAATVDEALRLLAGERPDVALLDVNLRGELVTPVAEKLRARDVPFVLASAYAIPELQTSVLEGALNLGKPIDEGCLLAALAQAVGQSQLWLGRSFPFTGKNGNV